MMKFRRRPSDSRPTPEEERAEQRRVALDRLAQFAAEDAARQRHTGADAEVDAAFTKLQADNTPPRSA